MDQGHAASVLVEGANVFPGLSSFLDIGLQRFLFQTKHTWDFMGANAVLLTQCPLTGVYENWVSTRTHCCHCVWRCPRWWLAPCLRASSYSHGQGSWSPLPGRVSDPSLGASWLPDSRYGVI